VKRKDATPPTTRVAVYTRQSVASDLEFGSIEAQREAVEAFVASQRGEGWVALPDRYDDHGFSGGNTERPAFQRLLKDIEAGRVDVIAAYKIDRLSRSLGDFTGFMSLLEQHGVGFVSTTQSFDTRSSMGRLTLNILASFSQFERETIAERTRDKIAATRRKGMWTGGRPVLGYDVVDKQLVINEPEAATVRQIVELYLAHGGLIATVGELERRGIRNKSWTNKAGKTVRGRAFTKTTLHALLTNPLYAGKVRCGNEVVDGKHEAILDGPRFAEVQRALKTNRRTPPATTGKWGAILAGIVRCGRCGAAMSHTATRKGERLFRYYVCQTSLKQGAAACQGSRAPAADLEDVVLTHIRGIGKDPSVLLATMTAAREARIAQKPELIAEARRLGTERTMLDGQRRNLLDALQEGGGAASAISARIAEVDEQLGRLDARHAEVANTLAAIETDAIDEAAMRDLLAGFTPLWDELIPRERARVLQLLIEEVRYDGQQGELAIEFRDNGIRGLQALAEERMTA